MTIDMDDEILQDFLVEAGEILELLGEQLVELEKLPDDLELLNAIFRGFHTVKGGAGFLSIHPLVEVCHKAEDIFNELRQGDMRVTPELMDVFLQVLDVVNEMFDQVRAGEQPTPAAPEVMAALTGLAGGVENEKPEVNTSSAVNPKPEQPAPTASQDENQPIVMASAADAIEQGFEQMLGAVDEAVTQQPENGAITESEFEDLLDALHGKGGSPTPGGKAKSDTENELARDSGEISEAEFEALLDEMHGKGKFATTNISQAEQENPSPEGNKASVQKDDGISEEEFQAVLDDIHGKGKFSGESVLATSNQDLQQPQIEETARVSNENQSPLSRPEKKPEIELVVNPESEKKATVSKIASAKKTPKPAVAQGETSVRVDTQTLDEIMNMVGELVLVRNRFQTLRSSGGDEEISKAVGNLDVVTANLQLAVMKTRMQPIKKVFGRFPRVVRDLARSLKKEIKLELIGEDTDLDKNLVEALADPLVHLVRNAVDHGIESPEQRLSTGKSREGTVVLSASQEGDHIQLTIEDNGKGMNPDVLRKIAVEKGIMDEESASRLDDKECFNLIFAPGFSTKEEISDVSGRGVGMDVVKTRIAQMNGTVEIDSIEGKGSTIIIKVPLTLAIMPTLMVKLGLGQAFALPLANVLEILDLDLRATNIVDGQLVIMVRDRALPLFYLSDWLITDPNYTADKKTTAHVVLVNAGGRQIGFVVDQLIGQEEVVIKPLGAKLQGMEGLAGATITGDGKIALILDVPGLVKRYAA
jgi:two-component system chemotaxis sensor kinase CheA